MYATPSAPSDGSVHAALWYVVASCAGGELQRVAITLALGAPADIYLIDEPSAYLDSEQRIIAAKVIKRFIMHCKKTAFIVEHDFIMATYLADRVIVYEGQPSLDAVARAPQSLVSGAWALPTVPTAVSLALDILATDGGSGLLLVANEVQPPAPS